ncbi:MAG: hypothetical protein Q4A86_04895 [Clostridia bacterium]|nr:hypothetical protein [Clostridia bacterium]
MNNKLIARVVAGAMAVAMLGTVSFATKIDGNKNTVTPGDTVTESGYDGQAVKTFMAFATETASKTAPDTANGDVIIALGQENDIPETITVDPDKIGENDYVIVIYSGTNGTQAKSIINVSTQERAFTLDTDIERSFRYTNVEEGIDNEYINLAYAEYTFSPADSTLTKVGFKFNGTKNGEAREELDISMDCNITGGGTIKYGAVVYGVLSTDNISAEPYAVYADFIE